MLYAYYNIIYYANGVCVPFGPGSGKVVLFKNIFFTGIQILLQRPITPFKSYLIWVTHDVESLVTVTVRRIENIRRVLLFLYKTVSEIK